MICEITISDGGTPVTLADSPDEPISDLRVSDSGVIQSVARARAEYMTHFYRGNRAGVLTFTGTKKHSTAQDALEAALTFRDTVPRAGTLSFTTIESGTDKTWNVPDCVIESVNCVGLKGKSTRWEYAIRLGGAATLVTP